MKIPGSIKMKGDFPINKNEGKIKGGVHVVDTISARNNIPKRFRGTPGKFAVITLRSGAGNTSQMWDFINEPGTEFTTNSDWQEKVVGKESDSGYKYVGFWNPDNVTEVTIFDSDAVGQNGKFYSVSGISSETTVTISGLFGGVPTAVNPQDRIVSNGTKWIVKPETTPSWATMTDIPQSILDYANGIVQSHGHAIIDITGLQSELNSKFDSDDVADSSQPYGNIPATALVDKDFIETFVYTQDEIDILFSGVGGGEGIINWDNILSGASISVDKYYGYDDKIWLCKTAHAKAAEFDYAKFEYQNQVDLRHYTWTVVAGQAGTQNPVFIIPNAFPGEINKLQKLTLTRSSVKTDHNTDPAYSAKTWTIGTDTKTNDKITLDLGASSGNWFNIGDEVSIQYYRDEAQVTGRAYSVFTQETDLTPNTTVASGYVNTGLSPSKRPVGNVMVVHDNTGYVFVTGFNDKTKNIFWSDDGGTTALSKNDAITPGVSFLYYRDGSVPLIGSFGASTRLSLYYSEAQLEGNFTLGGSIISKTPDTWIGDNTRVPSEAMVDGRTYQAIRDTAANFTSNNPVLTARQMGIETDTGKFKFGDGSTNWNSLAYAASGGSGTGVKNVYATIAAMTGAQGTDSQVENEIFEVTDASSDSTVDSGTAWYRYKGVANGVIADYEKISEEEARSENLTDRRTFTSSAPTITANQATLDFDSKNEGEFRIASTITAALEILLSNTTNAVRCIIKGKMTGTFGIDLTEFGTTVCKPAGDYWTFSAGVVTIEGDTATTFEISVEKQDTQWNIIPYVHR